jgi:Transposase DDE domain
MGAWGLGEFPLALLNFDWYAIQPGLMAAQSVWICPHQNDQQSPSKPQRTNLCAHKAESTNRFLQFWAQQSHTAITILVSKRGKKSPSIDLQEVTRIDAYLQQLKITQPHLPKTVKHVVVDGFYSKEKFVNGVVGLGLHMVGKLRVDANLRHIFTGEQRPRGARRKYGDKVDLNDVTGLSWVQDLEPNLKLYTALVWHVSLKRQVRMAYLSDTHKPDQVRHVVLFSTDLDLCAFDIFYFYKARFQIEFIFRDAKQFTGLTDCQARSESKLDFHFNASLTALNLAKFEAQQHHLGEQPFVFSMASYKRLALNHHLLELFISNLDLNPTLIKNHPNYQKLCSYGSLIP